MPFFAEPRCPQCQAPVPLANLWRRAPKDRSGIFLIGKIAVACPACEAKLRVLHADLVMVTVGSFVLLCAVFGALGAIEHTQLGKVRDDLNLLLIAPAMVGWMFFFRRYGYRFAQVRAVENGEKVLLVSSKPILEQPSAHKRTEPTEVKSLPQVAADPPGSERPPWVCPECQEENPGQFARCCICDTERDAGAPH